VNLDITVYKDGFFGDMSIMTTIGKVPKPISQIVRKKAKESE